MVVRASASKSIDLDSFSNSIHTKRLLKMVFTPSLLDAQYERDDVEDKPTSLLVVSLGKIVNVMPLFICGGQVVE